VLNVVGLNVLSVDPVDAVWMKRLQ
jgi:hypothetical protein